MHQGDRPRVLSTPEAFRHPQPEALHSGIYDADRQHARPRAQPRSRSTRGLTAAASSPAPIDRHRLASSCSRPSLGRRFRRHHRGAWRPCCPPRDARARAGGLRRWRNRSGGDRRGHRRACERFSGPAAWSRPRGRAAAGAAPGAGRRRPRPSAAPGRRISIADDAGPRSIGIPDHRGAGRRRARARGRELLGRGMLSLLLNPR